MTTLLVSFYFIKFRYEKALTLLLGLIVMLAERTGLEPAPPGVTGRSLFNKESNQLNYRSFSFIFLNEKSLCISAEAFVFVLAERTGLEPATPGVTGRSLFNKESNQLNYRSFSFIFLNEKSLCILVIRSAEAFVFVLAERTGLEPATPGVTGRYSNQLNYRSFRPKSKFFYRH